MQFYVPLTAVVPVLLAGSHMVNTAVTRMSLARAAPACVLFLCMARVYNFSVFLMDRNV